MSAHEALLDNLLPYIKKAVTFRPPDNSKRPANASTNYDAPDFVSPARVVLQVGCLNWVSQLAAWFEKGMQAIGLQETTGFNGGALLGLFYIPATIRTADATCSSSVEHIYLVIGSGLSNLQVRTRTQATKILFDAKKTVKGVEVNFQGASFTINAVKEAILSAGTFQSPQLLMISGIGPADELGKFSIPFVVHSLGCHSNGRPTGSKPGCDGPDGTAQDGLLSSDSIELLGFEKLPAEHRTNFSTSTLKALKKFPSDWLGVEYLQGNAFFGDCAAPTRDQPLNGKQYAAILGTLVAPLSRGNVTLASASGLDLPQVNPNWLMHGADQQVAIALFRRLREVWSSAAINMKRIVIGEEYWPGLHLKTEDEILDQVRESLMTVWHASGTCKMGQADDKTAVVDNSARSLA
ncbi:hypothetical protein BGZ63DRAFT_429426 [Mariannaea sp. PMI_226]|nr:hypothetical protein BGZ63DRAFT_429426 [Mariannaea sp. PMI_226]